jgi:hypothetical protein
MGLCQLLYDMGLVTRIYKELKQTKLLKDKWTNEKLAKELNKAFLKEGVQMA